MYYFLKTLRFPELSFESYNHYAFCTTILFIENTILISHKQQTKCNYKRLFKVNELFKIHVHVCFKSILNYNRTFAISLD